MIRRVEDLTELEVAQIKGMYLRKDRQIDIAQWHNIAVAQVHRIIHGYRKEARRIEPAPPHQLPPPGPYQVVTKDDYERISAAAVMPSKQLDELLAEFRELRGQFDELTGKVQAVLGGGSCGDFSGRERGEVHASQAGPGDDHRRGDIPDVRGSDRTH